LPFRKAHGKVRPVIVQTAKKIAPNTYVPTIGDEIGLPHFIYNESLVKKHYKDFQIVEKWKDSRDYFCFIAKLK
jgi:diaminopimelate decarboxylase